MKNEFEIPFPTEHIVFINRMKIMGACAHHTYEFAQFCGSRFGTKSLEDVPSVAKRIKYIKEHEVLYRLSGGVVVHTDNDNNPQIWADGIPAEFIPNKK